LNASQVTLENNDYWMERDVYFEVLPADSEAIVFLGTSITHNFELTEHFAVPHLQNRGINGDNLRGMLHRMAPILSQRPNKIFIEVGINDLGADLLASEVVADDLKTLILRMNASVDSSCQLYVLSILPVRNSAEEMSTYCSPEMNTKIDSVNILYRDYCSRMGIPFIDAHQAFVHQGQMKQSYTTDGVHLSGKGYMKLAEILRPYAEDNQ
jgi:lysophospholipase L1-like esterase